MLHRVNETQEGPGQERIPKTVSQVAENQDEALFKALWEGGRREEAEALFPLLARRERRRQIPGKLPWLGKGS